LAESFSVAHLPIYTLISQPISAQDERNDPPSANQSVSKLEPRHGHAVCTFWVHPPTSHYPALSAEAEPISKGHCRKWRRKMKVSCHLQTVTSRNVLILAEFNNWNRNFGKAFHLAIWQSRKKIVKLSTCHMWHGWWLLGEFA